MAKEIQTASDGASINPFPAMPVVDERLNVGTVEIEKSRAVAEVQAALLIAQRFPRNKALAWERIKEECQRKDFAEEAIYAYPRGGKTVRGLTIRSAEMTARNWGNIEFGLRELAVYDGETEFESYAWDMETNTRSKQTFRSKHERHTKDGVTRLVDPRDIYENNANLGSRRMRSRMLALIPGDVQQMVMAECEKTLAGELQMSRTDHIRSLITKFGKLGIGVKLLEQKLEHPVDEILPDEFTDLLAIHNSLRDKQSQPSDWFAVPKTVAASEAAKEIDEALFPSGEERDPNPVARD